MLAISAAARSVESIRASVVGFAVFDMVPHIGERDASTCAWPTRGGLHAREFEKNDRELNVRVEGQLNFNEARMMITAATAGAGPALLLEDQVKSLIADRRLVRVLADWYAPFPGYRLYYPTRHQLYVLVAGRSPALSRTQATL
jgi:DNA-binding transcriptional LysR family regulator